MKTAFHHHPIESLRSAAAGAVCAVAIAAAMPLHAAQNNSVAQAQAALKREQYFHGKVSGVADEETASAVRRFQIRQGLRVTGALDAETLTALKIKGPPANVVASDQEFLQNVETAAQARQGGPKAVQPKPRPKPSPSATPRRRETPTRETAPAPASEFIDGREPVSENEVLDVIDGFLDAASGDTPERELSFYAKAVDYFNEGRVRYAEIERDQRNYYRRWPERDFRLAADPEIVRTDPRGATVRYRVRYTLRNGDKEARGETEHMVRFNRTRDGLKISAIRERKLN